MFGILIVSGWVFGKPNILPSEALKLFKYWTSPALLFGILIVSGCVFGKLNILPYDTLFM